MTSPRSPGFALLAALVAIAAGCGNYSTEDLRFLSALPRRDDLRIAVPAPGAPGAGGLVSGAGYSAACPAGSTLGDATIWQWAKPTSDGLNRGVDFLVGLVDKVRSYPPTVRHDDARRWGPFDADHHPGRELRVLMDRTWPAGTDADPVFEYRFQGRVKGTATWHDLVTGSFFGHSASRGKGTVSLDFARFHLVGVNDADTPTGSMRIGYDRASEPVTIDLELVAGASGGFGVVSFAYHFVGYGDGTGAFDYAFTNANQDLLEVSTGYAASHAGRLQVKFTGNGGAPVGIFNQCWDAGECLVYVDDPLNLSCGTPPCSDTTTPSACVAVPVAPFTP